MPNTALNILFHLNAKKIFAKTNFHWKFIQYCFGPQYHKSYKFNNTYLGHSSRTCLKHRKISIDEVVKLCSEKQSQLFKTQKP